MAKAKARGFPPMLHCRYLVHPPTPLTDNCSDPASNPEVWTFCRPSQFGLKHAPWRVDSDGKGGVLIYGSDRDNKQWVQTVPGPFADDGVHRATDLLQLTDDRGLVVVSSTHQQDGRQAANIALVDITGRQLWRRGGAVLALPGLHVVTKGGQLKAIWTLQKQSPRGYHAVQYSAAKGDLQREFWLDLEPSNIEEHWPYWRPNR